MIDQQLRNRHLLAVDAFLLMGAPLLAYTLRFEGLKWSEADAHTALLYTILSVPLKLGIFFALGLYRRLWRQAGMVDLEQIVQAAFASAAVCAFLGIVVLPTLDLTALRVPISVVILDAFFTVTALAAPRVLAKAAAVHRQQRRRSDEKRVLVAGAGAAGELMVKELRSNPQLGLTAVGFVDDDRAKHHQRLCDLPVFGSLADIREVAVREKIGEIVIAMPSAPGTVVRRVLRAAIDLDIPARTVPGIFDILSGRVGVSALRKVEIQDLLRRAPVKTDMESVRALVQGQTVLVTGAGGSIGSELCRQLAALDPARLVLLGHGENSIFEIVQELRKKYPSRTIISVIADVRDARRISRTLERYCPHVVFHAAAHKHVPLMEQNVVEAVTNNVLGTRNMINATVEAGGKHFVMISTDKAVSPTSVMGATKRAAELVVQHAAAMYGRNFVAVRFGNVLGSRGSVIPTFLRQIEGGGPVTITHPDMTRFFMTIPEAIQLVLQAATLGKGGEVFALDMGEPVKIVDLATDLIRLSGLEVGTDIDIEFTGLRPGEKLNEEVFFRGEHVTPTRHPKVLHARNIDLIPNVDQVIDHLIEETLGARSDLTVRELLRGLVPDFAGGGADIAPPVRAPQWIGSLGVATPDVRIGGAERVMTGD